MLINLKCISAVPSFLFVDIANVVNNPVCKQCVRWKRKPIWMPTAKSKLFRVPPRPVIPQEDKDELHRLNTNYKTYMKSVKAYLCENVDSSASRSEDMTVLAQAEKDDFASSKAINDKWNSEVAKIREQRMSTEKEERMNLISKRLEERTERQRARIAEIEEVVRKEKEREKDYITPENIDEAIENALRGMVNYNYAIDTKGNIYNEDKDGASRDGATKKMVETNA